MRANTFTLAISLALVSQPALPFDQDEFCDSVTEVAQRMNARRGRWLDRSTRHDGVVVDCDAKTLEAKRFINAAPDDMREGWEARKQRQWKAACCNHESWRRPSTMAGASFSTLTFRNGEQAVFVAECE